jgi:hypothetical protein
MALHHRVGDPASASSPEGHPADAGQVICVDMVGKDIILWPQGGLPRSDAIQGKPVGSSDARHPQSMRAK